jgi:hypothetical protein
MTVVPKTDAHPRHGAMVCLVTVAIVVATYLPQLGAPLELQDDHRIIAPVITPHPGGVGGALGMWASAIRDDVYGVGRFRPVMWAFEVIGPLILGPSAFVWHVLLLLLAAAVATLLYVSALKVWRSPSAASVFVLVALLAPDPGPTAAWYRLGPKEAWGMLLLAAALATMVFNAGKSGRRSEFVSFGFLALAALSKESFVLLLPAMFGVRLWLEARTSQSSLSGAFRRLRMTATAYGALFLAGIAAILFVVRSAGSHSYGGRSLSLSLSGTMRALMRDLVRAPSLSIWFVPVLLACWVAWRRRGNTWQDFFAVILFLAWAGPQFALYATRGGMWDHYWIPCIVAFAAASAASIEILSREPQPFFYRLAMVVFGLWLLNAIRIDVSAVMNFKAKARVQQEAVRIAADHVTAQSMLVIVADGDVESERAPSFADFVRFRGARYRRALLYDSRCIGGPCRLLDLQSGEILDSVDANDVSVVVHLDQTEPRSAVLWDSPADFQPESAVGQYRFLSLRQHRWVDIPFQIRVDVRRHQQAGSVGGA